MRTVAQLLSLLSFTAVSCPCLLYFAGGIGLETVQWLALLGTIGWFVATPVWMGRSAAFATEPVI